MKTTMQLTGYGMTEVLVTHSTPRSEPKLGYCGKLMPHVQAQVICTETGNSLPPGQKGELLIKTPSVCFSSISTGKNSRILLYVLSYVN